VAKSLFGVCQPGPVDDIVVGHRWPEHSDLVVKERAVAG